MKPMILVITAVLTLLAGTSYGVNGDFIYNRHELRTKYRYLYNLKVKEESSTHKRFHKGQLFKKNGLNILYLEGDEFEMAFQHGKLLAEEIRQGSVIDAANMANNAINITFQHKPIIRNLAKKVIDKKYTTKFLKNVMRSHPKLSRSVLNRNFAVSEASGVPINTLIDASLNPSVMMMLANQEKSEDETGVAVAPANGCTSFGLWGDYTHDGELVVGRNTDYPLGGAFERNATIIYFNPTDGRQKFMSITTAGVHTASVTAINEAGLYLGTHSLPSKYTGQTGVPMITWIHDVVSKSDTLDDAVKLLRSRKTGVGWTYVLASPAEKRVVSLEVDHKDFGLRESVGGKHIQTNHYLAPNMASHTLAFNRGVYEETYSRFRRADKLIESYKGTITPQDIIRILGDQTDDFTGELNGFPSNIGATTTVSSLIYEPSENHVYVANGSAPVAHNAYVQLPLPADFDPNNFQQENLDTIQNHWFRNGHPGKFQALKTYIKAKEVFEYTYNSTHALSLVKKAFKLAPDVGHYAIMQGLLEIRSDRFGHAYRSFQQALASKLSPHGKNLAYYYMARILADSRRTGDAQNLLRRILNNPAADAKIKTAARDFYRKASKRRRVKLKWHQVVPQFQFGDVQKY